MKRIKAKVEIEIVPYEKRGWNDRPDSTHKVVVHGLEEALKKAGINVDRCDTRNGGPHTPMSIRVSLSGRDDLPEKETPCMHPGFFSSA